MLMFNGKLFSQIRKSKYPQISKFRAAMNALGVDVSWVALKQWEQGAVTPRSDLYLCACDVLAVDPYLFFTEQEQQNDNSTDGKPV
jgi:hypothetical protein